MRCRYASVRVVLGGQCVIRLPAGGTLHSPDKAAARARGHWASAAPPAYIGLITTSSSSAGAARPGQGRPAEQIQDTEAAVSYGANFLLSGHGAQRARAAACQSSPTLKHGGRLMWGWALVTGHRVSYYWIN